MQVIIIELICLSIVAVLFFEAEAYSKKLFVNESGELCERSELSEQEYIYH